MWVEGLDAFLKAFPLADFDLPHPHGRVSSSLPLDEKNDDDEDDDDDDNEEEREENEGNHDESRANLSRHENYAEGSARYLRAKTSVITPASFCLILYFNPKNKGFFFFFFF